MKSEIYYYDIWSICLAAGSNVTGKRFDCSHYNNVCNELSTVLTIFISQIFLKW